MLKTTKVAISLPKEDFEKIENIRKKSGLKRSFIIDRAIRFWLEYLEKKEKIRKYEEGYRRKPEDIDEIKAMEKASAEAFAEEGWK